MLSVLARFSLLPVLLGDSPFPLTPLATDGSPWEFPVESAVPPEDVSLIENWPLSVKGLDLARRFVVSRLEGMPEGVLVISESGAVQPEVVVIEETLDRLQVIRAPDPPRIEEGPSCRWHAKVALAWLAAIALLLVLTLPFGFFRRSRPS